MDAADPKARFDGLCRGLFKQMYPQGDQQREARLTLELTELLKLRGVPEYFLDLYDRKVRYAENERNLFVVYLMGLAPDFDVARRPQFTKAEFPDQDIDYLVKIRDYLKNDFAPRVFGRDKVCSIGNYATYGIKSALIDCTRIYEGDRMDIMKLTKPMALKDDEGDPMTWESALDMYPEFNKWVQANEEIAEAAQDLMYSRDVDWPKYGFKGEPPHRVRTTGMHAGGLVISSVPVAEYVPLIRGKEGVPCTAWAEGLHSQDLTLVGQVKFDLLVVDALEKIALAIKMIREEDPSFGKLSARPGGPHWSDRSYRNDPRCIEMANAGDLKGVFQFDSDGIRELAKFGGVTNFEDIVAYTSLYRPGPMDVGMHMTYCRRKRGEEEYEIHPLLEPVLKRSYGVMCIEENTKVSLADGSERSIKDMAAGVPVHSYNPSTMRMEVKDCHGCGPTRVGPGVRIVLANGLSVVLTPDHKVWTSEGMKEAGTLLAGIDHVGVPVKVPDGPGCGGLTAQHAYLLGRLVGDGNVAGSQASLCCGTSREEADRFARWLKDNTAFRASRVYFRTRCWYVAITSDRTGLPAPHHRRTAVMEWLDQHGCRHRSRDKTVPAAVLCGMEDVKWAFLAGLFESDGCGVVTKGGSQVAYFASAAEGVLGGVRRLCQSLGLSFHRCGHKVYIWDTKLLHAGVSRHLHFKHLGGRLSDGMCSGWVPSEWVGRCRRQGESVRAFCERTGLSRRNLGRGKKFVRPRTAEKAGAAVGDLRYHKVVRVEAVERASFYGMSVADNHNLVAGGMVVKNCYQEDVFRVLNIVGRIPLAECQGIIKAISKKNLAKIKVFKDAFVENGQQTLGFSRAQMEEFWAAVQSFAGYGFNRGHAVAYSTLSAQMLYLKVYYPVQFYAALMSCLKTADDRLPDYKRDAENHGVTIQEVDENGSRENFSIQGGKIYWGLSKVKGIGDEMAGRIVASQPYSGFDDFLNRFGTEANVVKPMLGLRVFDEHDGITMWRFYVQYKDLEGKRSDAAKRWSKRKKELYSSISETLGTDVSGLAPDSIAQLALRKGKDKEFQAWLKKYSRSHGLVQKWLNMPQFGWAAYDAEKCVAIDKVTQNLLDDLHTSQEAYYGFVWTHPMRFLEGWDPLCTFEKHKLETAFGGSWLVDLEIIKVARCISKRKTEYTQLEVQDADFKKERVNVWQEDSGIFREVLKAGNVVRMMLTAPNGGFKTYQLESRPGPRWKKRLQSGGQMDQYDYRVQLVGTMEDAKAIAERDRLLTTESGR